LEAWRQLLPQPNHPPPPDDGLGGHRCPDFQRLAWSGRVKPQDVVAAISFSFSLLAKMEGGERTTIFLVSVRFDSDGCSQYTRAECKSGVDMGQELFSILRRRRISHVDFSSHRKKEENQNYYTSLFITSSVGIIQTDIGPASPFYTSPKS
jgi:hypothetical protein